MMHSGKSYHDFMLGSRRDRKARERLQRLVFRLMPPHGTILDFGAGTGIDAKCYAARGFTVFAHEPSENNLAYLREYCRQEIAKGEITITDLSATAEVQMIVANFAVLNLIGDHKGLFAKFASLLAPEGFVLVSLLNPFFLGDARYSWWRHNLGTLGSTGAYAVQGEFGPVYRFVPPVVARAAEPAFRLVARVPAGMGIAVSRYMFLLFQKR
jgi:2-polyprenyl-3-methyl-5-hydroxy-6-metoxy-1,4-benzoquinol methylase